MSKTPNKIGLPEGATNNMQEYEQNPFKLRFRSPKSTEEVRIKNDGDDSGTENEKNCDPVPIRKKEKGCNKNLNRSLGCSVIVFFLIILYKIYWLPSGPKFSFNLTADDKSKLDTSDYQIGKLDTNVDFMIVTDPQVSKAAVGIGVSAGSWDNPTSLPGLAHFLEHLVFLGSERYDFASNWGEFIGKYGGMDNAYTDREKTVYYTELEHDGLFEVIDRMSAAVQRPTLLEDTLKEVNAVDSEHTKNLQNPIWRMARVTGLLYDPDGYSGRWGTGNEYTLKTKPEEEKIDVVAELKKFHKTHYCSQNTVVVVLSKFDASIVYEKIEKFFDLPESTTCPKNPNRGKREFRVGTFAHMYNEVSPTGRININFSIPIPYVKENLGDPGPLIQYLLNYYGEDGGGLRGILYNRALVTEALGTVRGDSDATKIVIYALPMPDADPMEIIEIVFQYLEKVIAKLSKEELEKIAKSLIRSRIFQWSWKKPKKLPYELVEDWTDDFLDYQNKDWNNDMKNILKPEGLQYDHDRTMACLKGLRYDNANIIQLDRGPKENFSAEQRATINYKEHKEEYYGIEYYTRNMPPRLSKLKEEITEKELKHPPIVLDPPVVTKTLEDFKCEDPTNLKFNQYGKAPEIIVGDTTSELKSRLFYRKGSVFKIPKFTLDAKIVTDVVLKTPEGRTKLNLFNQAFNFAFDPLQEKYDKLVLSCHFEFGHEEYLTLQFSINGIYGDAVNQFLDEAMDLLLKKDFVTDALEKRTFHSTTLSVTDYSTTLPIRNLNVMFKNARSQYSVQREEQKEVLPSLKGKLKDIVSFIRGCFKQVRIDTFAMGAIEQEDAKLLTERLHKKFTVRTDEFKLSPVYSRRKPLDFVIVNPADSDTNRSAVLTMQSRNDGGKPTSWKNMVTGSILNSILGPFTFDELRTKAEKPPYVVFGHVQVMPNFIMLNVGIQDHNMEIDEMFSKLQKHVNESFKKKLEDLNDEDVNTYKETVRNSQLAPPSGPSPEFDFYEAALKMDGRKTCFYSRKMIHGAVDSVSKQDLLDMYNRIVKETPSTARMYENGADIDDIKKKNPHLIDVKQASLELSSTDPDFWHDPVTENLECKE